MFVFVVVFVFVYIKIFVLPIVFLQAASVLADAACQVGGAVVQNGL